MKGPVTWVEISRQALIDNLTGYQKIVGDKTEVWPVVKSNAYGHGLAEVVSVLKDRVDGLAVVNSQEARQLLGLGFAGRILVLSYFEEKDLPALIAARVELPVYDYSQLTAFSAAAKKVNRSVRVHLKIDTGTSRLGILPRSADNFLDRLRHQSRIELVGLYTHFADSEEDIEFTKDQGRKLRQAVKKFELGSEVKIHAACSAATIAAAACRFDLVRLGLSTYGLWPSEKIKLLAARNNPGFGLQPAMTWKTRLIQVKDLPAGSTVGYGRTYRTEKKMKLGILPVGYNEGYVRLLSNKGEVLIAGCRCPARGRICMNLTMIELPADLSVGPGEEVVLLGAQNGEKISAEELADKTGTINYEVVTRINSSLPRVVVD